MNTASLVSASKDTRGIFASKTPTIAPLIVATVTGIVLIGSTLSHASVTMVTLVIVVKREYVLMTTARITELVLN